MVASFTPNIQLTEPARGDDVGTWDTPVNGNMTLLDLVAGGIATISLNNSNVILTAGQFQSRNITFNSTLTGSVTITFPTSFTKSYEIQHLCTGSSAFTITLETTATGGQVIAVPPGVTIDCFNDGTNIKFKNLWGPVGSYMDFANSSAPIWVTGCTVPPFLNCDGTSFSSGTFPALAAVLGGTTLPDRRGTTGATLNQGTGRLVNVINASSVGVVGGADQITLSALQVPTITGTVTVAPSGGNLIPLNTTVGQVTVNAGSATEAPASANAWTNTGSLSGTMTSNNTGGGAHGNVQPTTVYGICMIRAG